MALTLRDACRLPRLLELGVTPIGDGVDIPRLKFTLWVVAVVVVVVEKMEADKMAMTVVGRLRDGPTQAS